MPVTLAVPEIAVPVSYLAAVAAALLLLSSILLILLRRLSLRRPAPADPTSWRTAVLIVAGLGLALGAGAAGYWLSLRFSRGRAEMDSYRILVLSRSVEDLHNTVQRLYEIESEALTRTILSQPRYRDPKRLSRFEAKIYSQGGEDGIIAEIFRRIGVTNKVYVEFGSGNGQENNTVFLLRSGWSGLWIEASADQVKSARKHFAREIQAGRLTVLNAFVTAENIEELFGRANVPAELDLLSIDIDRNDYWVWRKIQRYRPRVVVIEYNAMFPPGVEWVVEYDPKAWWDGSSHFGASLTSYERLGRQKGYGLVGCNLSGVSAFFVRQDLLRERFSRPYTAENHYEPIRYALQLRKLGYLRRP